MYCLPHVMFLNNSWYKSRLQYVQSKYLRLMAMLAYGRGFSQDQFARVSVAPRCSSRACSLASGLFPHFSGVGSPWRVEIWTELHSETAGKRFYNIKVMFTCAALALFLKQCLSTTGNNILPYVWSHPLKFTQVYCSSYHHELYTKHHICDKHNITAVFVVW